MENLTVSQIVNSTFRFFPHNSTYAIPGFYDLKPEDATWILSSTIVFFTMQTGMALLEAGIVSKKNQVNAMMKSVVDVCVGGLSFWMMGFGLMYGRGNFTNAFFGAGDFFVNAEVSDPLMGQVFSLYFIQMSFATKATTIVSGAVAERFRFSAYILFSFLSTLVYSIGGGWIWGQHGWLKGIGVVDFAGCGPIHIIGGAAAFAAAWFIGPRTNRYKNGTDPHPPGDPMTICIGLFIIWWGWIGFNAGSSYGITGDKWSFAARAGASTTIASMSAGMTSILFSMKKHKGKVDIVEVITGILSALVAINAGCFAFSMYSSVFVGIVAAILGLATAPLIDKMKIDDAVGATAIHLVNGVWGQLSVGLFADPESGPKGIFLGGGFYQLIVQAISAISLSIWAASATIAILWIVNKIIEIRLEPDEEMQGSDLIEHDIITNLTYSSEEQNNREIIDKDLNDLSSVERFSGPIDDRNRQNIVFGRRQTFHTNQSFERD